MADKLQGVDKFVIYISTYSCYEYLLFACPRSCVGYEYNRHACEDITGL